MNKEILNELTNVIQALNNIDVKGKANMLNLAGSIAMLEQIHNKCVSLADAKQEVSGGD